jgi:hypothetical protein
VLELGIEHTWIVISSMGLSGSSMLRIGCVATVPMNSHLFLSLLGMIGIPFLVDICYNTHYRAKHDKSQSEDYNYAKEKEIRR